MQEFIEHLKKGEFRMPVCMSCGCKAWPPSRRCPHCLSKTSLKRIEMKGTLIEFSSSYIKGREGVFGLVEMSCIKLVGSFANEQLKEGMRVRMTGCGVKPDGAPFYLFAPARA